jgi:ADP-ribose pyrophosphatase YjhB (NUDIX family)
LSVSDFELASVSPCPAIGYQSPVPASNPNWLDPADWKWVQDHVPVACVDVIPVLTDRSTLTICQVGLIHRDTPHQGRRWCLCGGRLWRNESFADAAARQLRETLGGGIRFTVDFDTPPLHVTQYFTDPVPHGWLDPRQHAVAAVFIVAIQGEVVPGGEAHGFDWFAPGSLPPDDQWGFGQDRVARICLERWGKS